MAKRQIVVSAVFGLAIVAWLMALAFKVNLDAAKQQNVATLPELHIALNDITLREISNSDKKEKFENNQILIQSDGVERWIDDVQIKAHGNSTKNLPKVPFQIKFKHKIDLLGLGTHKKYILLAEAFDHTYIRNDLMLKMAEMLGSLYNQRGRHVVLYVDEKYEGLYYLVPKLEIAKNSVDLRGRDAGLFEIDTLHRAGEECFETWAGECMTLNDAVMIDDAEMREKVILDFVEKYNKFEQAVVEGDFGEVDELVDVESFARYFLLSEFAVNPDAYVSSFYFYTNGPEDKIHAGPFWDFDFAFGNRNWVWNSNEDFYSPELSMVQKRDVFTEEREGLHVGKVMYYLVDMPEFQDVVRRIFSEKLSGRKQELIMEAQIMATRLRVEAARDAEFWKRGDAAAETEYLIDWLDRRFDYFEQKYGTGAPEKRISYYGEA